jgi:hypothetical protein
MVLKLSYQLFEAELLTCGANVSETHESERTNDTSKLHDQVMRDGMSSSYLYDGQDSSPGRESRGGHTPDNW